MHSTLIRILSPLASSAMILVHSLMPHIHPLNTKDGSSRIVEENTDHSDDHSSGNWFKHLSKIFYKNIYKESLTQLKKDLETLSKLSFLSASAFLFIEKINIVFYFIKIQCLLLFINIKLRNTVFNSNLNFRGPPEQTS